MKFRVAVIGAGPAGLAAACALSGENIDVIVYDSGKELRDREHDVASDLPVGVGGAGLFSDGKFSYYPAGTYVYSLPERDKLRSAFRWLSAQLRNVGIDAESFPDTPPFLLGANQFNQKGYPSHFGSLDQRKRLIAQLVGRIRSTILTNSTVRQIEKLSNREYLITAKDDSGDISQYKVRAIVLATGRLGSLDLLDKELCKILPLREIRYEFGVRVEYPESIPFQNINAKDVKLLWENGLTQFRTFCTCRSGEVWNIPYDDFSALSGRSDGPSTGFSNFGILARFRGAGLTLGRSFWNYLRNHSLKSDTVATWEPIGSFLQDPSLSVILPNITNRPWHPHNKFQRGEIRKCLGEKLYLIMKTGIQDLISRFPELAHNQAICLFPSVEGIGYYPDTDRNLKVKRLDLWCAGDVAGHFRGLIPAFLSGYYVGLCTKESIV